MVAQVRGCEGFPLGTCMVLLSSGRELCQYCQRSKELASGPVHVSDVLAEQGYAAARCKCGGIDDGPLHAQSLLHLRYLGDGPENARQIPAEEAAPVAVVPRARFGRSRL